MKTIKGVAHYNVNDKIIMIISDEYKGFPLIAYQPDILMVSETIAKRYKNEIFDVVKMKKVIYI